MTLGLDHHRLLDLTRTGEAVIRVGSQSKPTFIVNHPDLVRVVLVDRRDQYDKRTFINTAVLRGMTGNSLVNSNGQEWERQRQAANRLLAESTAVGCAELIGAQADRVMRAWDTMADGETIWALAEMSRIVLRITGQLLFQFDLSMHEDALISGHDTVVARMRPSDPQFRDAVAGMRIAAGAVVAGATGAATPLGAWVADRTRDAQGVDGVDLTGEIIAMIVASYETTAIALSWTWMLLAEHPEVRARLEREVDGVLGDGPIGSDHIQRLSYVRAVVDESMRLYPPAWSLARRAAAPDTLGGVAIPEDAIVMIYPYTMHRHPAYWTRPELFDPTRFLPDRSAERPQFAYFPFGAGPRTCVGRRLALVELVVLVASISRRWRLNLVPGQMIESEARINLRPKGDFRLTLERRRSGG